MKKLLLSLSFFACAYSSRAQIIFSENFEASQTSIPAGWKQQLPSYVPKNFGWFFDTIVSGPLGAYIPKHSFYAFVDDADYNYPPVRNRDSLYTPVINLSGYSHVFVSYDVWYYGYYFVNPGDFEVASLAVSTNGGLTWTRADTVGCWGGHSNWRTVVYDLSAYGNNPNVKLAFTYDDLGNNSSGEAIDNVKVYVPLLYDVGVNNSGMWYLCQTGSSNTVQGSLYNFGADTITSMRINYSVNGGATVSENLAALSIPPLQYYNLFYSTMWVPPSAGNYVIKMWADNLNGANIDQDHINDTLMVNFIVMDTFETKMPLFEEFMQASCGPCMMATPNLDSVLTNNISICNPIRYHCNFPGRDFINEVTQNAVGARLNYYGDINGGTGIPDARLDGTTDISPWYVGSYDIQNAASFGSPFSITVSSSFNPWNNQYSVTANITAHAAMPAGIKARAVLTVDTIKYKQDQSIENPPSDFAPPIGSGSTADWYYPYVLNYPNVVEDIMPDPNGTRLPAFAKGQTRIINFSWIKNHAWGDSNKVWLYDSLSTTVTVFLENDSTKLAGAGAPTKYVYQSARGSVTTGLQNLSVQETYFDVYPNPASGDINITFRLAETQNIKIELYNLLGEKVNSVDNGKTSSGLHNLQLNTQSLNTGVYFIKLSTEVAATTKKLVIER